MSIASYRELTAWHRAMDLATGCYRLSAAFPKAEAYGLSSQLRRAAVSVPSNIAEGAGRIPTREYIHRAAIAHGSLLEVETQLRLAERLGYVSATEIEPLLATAGEAGRLNRGLIASLERKLASC